MITTLVAFVALLSAATVALLTMALPRRVAAAPAGSTVSLKWQPPLFASRLPGSRSNGSHRHSRPGRATMLTKCEAEDLLDWLEATGHPAGRLSYVPDQGFAVSWN